MIHESGVELLQLAVLKIATDDYIRYRRLYLKNEISDKEYQKELDIYLNCLNVWSPLYVDDQYILKLSNRKAEKLL
jgi:hypothetical protein